METTNAIPINEVSVFKENLQSVQGFVVNSIKDKRQAFADGFAHFKEGLTQAFNDKKNYVHLLTLPVNNFLKDLSQIEREFEEELRKNTEYCVPLNGKMVPSSEVLNMQMEENY